MLNSVPLHHLAYAQNSTLDQDNTNTGTGIGTGTTNITTESDLPNAISGPASLPKSQQFQSANMEKHKNASTTALLYILTPTRKGQGLH